MMKKRFYLLLIIAIAGLLLGGCASKGKYDFSPKKPYAYDDTKSYAFNMLASVTRDWPAVYDTPEGGKLLKYKYEKVPDYRAEKIADAAVTGVSLARVNSLGRVGVSPGAEFGALMALSLLSTPEGTGLLPGSSAAGIYGFIDQNGLSYAEATDKVLDILYDALIEAAETWALPEGLYFDEVAIRREAIEREYRRFVPPVVEAIIKGETTTGVSCDNDGEYVCSIIIPVRHSRYIHARSVISGHSPEWLGGQPTWLVISATPSPVIKKEGKIPQGLAENWIDLYRSEVFQKLSAHLPESFFTYFRPFNEKEIAQLPHVPITDPVKQPVVFHQGERHLFIPPGF